MDIKQMSSFLMFRITDGLENKTVENNYSTRLPIHNSIELEQYLESRVKKICKNKKVALALSGGIDSAILAKYMPKGSVAYTFKCVVPGVDVTDETPMAAKYAEECGLENRVVEIYWEDFENYAPTLMRYKGAPIHSIEVQIYKAALRAKREGFDTLLFGEAADAVYGGLSNLLSKDWTIGDFVERYSFVMPYKVLKKHEIVMEPYQYYSKNGEIDPHTFISKFFINESIGSYINACNSAQIEVVMPYPETYLYGEIDYGRIRTGENKYFVREVFSRLYPNFVIPPKTPMPRPMNEWFKDWEGPKREEFWPHCTDNMTGDQKWLVWVLEKWLNMLEENIGEEY